MSLLLICYPKCSTCQKARRFLDSNGVTYTERHIVEENPTAAELSQWQSVSGLGVKKFVNTSGMLYRQQNLKERFSTLSDAEIFEVLSTNGMLVKRPILVGEGFVLTGFKESDWREKLGLLS